MSLLLLLRTPAAATGLTTKTEQWQSSDDGVTGWTDIPGATIVTYVPVVGDIGNYLSVLETATIASDGSTASLRSNVLGPVIAAPVIIRLTLTPSVIDVLVPTSAASNAVYPSASLFPGGVYPSTATILILLPAVVT